jgi:hypothetical protein
MEKQVRQERHSGVGVHPRDPRHCRVFGVHGARSALAAHVNGAGETCGSIVKIINNQMG